MNISWNFIYLRNGQKDHFQSPLKSLIFKDQYHFVPLKIRTTCCSLYLIQGFIINLPFVAKFAKDFFLVVPWTTNHFLPSDYPSSKFWLSQKNVPKIENDEYVLYTVQWQSGDQNIIWGLQVDHRPNTVVVLIQCLLISDEE